MRTLIVLGLALGCAFMAGWFTVHRTDGETTIKINRDEIRSDASAAINRGREYLNDRDQPVDPYSQPQQQQFADQQFADQQFGQQQYGQGFNQGQPAFQNQTQALPAGFQHPNQPGMQLTQPANPQQSPPGTDAGFYYSNDPNAARPLPPWQQQNSNQSQGGRY